MPTLNQEMLPVVDMRDQDLGVVARSEVHRLGLLHRAVHILVFDRRGRIYLQRRSHHKDTHPGKWTSSASGHVDPGESYDQAAVRELKEELNLELDLHPLAKIPASQATENEFTMVYWAVTDELPWPNPQEICEGRYLEWDQALELAQDPRLAAPSMGLVLSLIGAPPSGQSPPSLLRSGLKLD